MKKCQELGKNECHVHLPFQHSNNYLLPPPPHFVCEFPCKSQALLNGLLFGIDVAYRLYVKMALTNQALLLSVRTS